MAQSDYYDVLSLYSSEDNISMIQSVFGNDCLGSHILEKGAKLYFNPGKKEGFENKLLKLNSKMNIQWQWEIQQRKDWHLSWQENFEPVIIKDKLAVISHWHAGMDLPITLKIKPGMAFGTGHHETTWLMLDTLLEESLQGKSVLDLGAGSGILSIASKMGGAKRVTAVEFDSDCESNFQENLALNNLQGKIQFNLHDVLSWQDLNYDLILANINRSIIEKLLPKLRQTRGKIIISGLLGTDEKTISDQCRKNRLTIVNRKTRGEWLCLILAAE